MNSTTRSIASESWPYFVRAVFLAFGFLLCGAPRAVDVSFTFLNATGVFLIFLFFAFSAWDWGVVLQSWIEPEKKSSGLGWELALGVGALAFLMAMAGHAGILGPVLRWPSLLVLTAGTFLRGYRPQLRQQGSSWRDLRDEVALSGKIQKLGFGIVALLLFIRVLHGFQLSRQGDPFIYELMAPRLWFDAGRIFVPRFMPYIAQAGSWSWVNLWGAVLLGGAPGEGLVALQHFGQWSQIFFGYGGTAWILAQVLRRLQVQRDWIWFWVLAALSIPEMKIVASLAKCDWGAVFWMFAGLLPWLTGSQPKKKLLVASGFLLGLSFTAKMSTGYSILPALFLLSLQLELRSIAILGLGFWVSALPVLLRNAYWTANPVFPALHEWFPPSVFGPSLSHAHSNLYTHETLSTWWAGRESTFRQVLGFWPILWIGLVPPVFKNPVSRFRFAIWIFPWLGLGLYLLHLGPHGLIRWVGPSWVALVVSGALSLEALVALLPRRISPKLIFGFFALSTVVLADLPLYTLAQVFGPKFQTGLPAIAIFFNNDGKAWIRSHVPAGKRLLLLGDNEPYYLSQYEVHIYNESVDVDRLFTETQAGAELGSGLLRLGFDEIVAFASTPVPVLQRLEELERAGFIRSQVREPWGQVWTVGHGDSGGKK